MPCINLTGQKFNRLTVIERAPNNNRGDAMWKCKCDCGKEIVTLGKALRTGHTKSCGCYKLEVTAAQGRKNALKLNIGDKFGKLTIIEKGESKKSTVNPTASNVFWICKCDCGNITSVSSSHLTSGHTKTCGKCNFSNGEYEIKNILEKNNISFECQKQFEDCVFSSGRKASFDFYINNYYVIEFDGEQHFKPRINNATLFTPEVVQEIKQRDKIKNDYCFSKGIPIIRIPYTLLGKIKIEDLELSTSKFILRKE